MRRKMKFLAGLMAAVMASATIADARTPLFRNGKTSYRIVLSPEASMSEKTAAGELQKYICQVSGAYIPIEATAGRHNIFIGWNESCGAPKPADCDESFTYACDGRDIRIYGGSGRGTMYGVFTFLENELGVKWYAPDCTTVPHMDCYTPERFSHTESPALKYRFAAYYGPIHDPVWMAHNKNNSAFKTVNNEYGNISAYGGAHTFGKFVNRSEYYDAHPEYYSLNDGKRNSTGQLCLSNPDVLKICIEGLRKEMRENPDYWVYSLSQNDNMSFCECEHCKALEDKYGGHSGAILWFVNQAADAVRDEFPDKYVGTFAYQYSRKAPVGIVPRDNVVIRLCSIECEFSHPLNANEFNRPFMDDLKKWSSIAPHLFIWDYVVDFAQYVAPFPNFQSLAENIRIFRDHNAIGVMEQAQYNGEGGEFCEMKAWVLTKLLWNPELDTDALVAEFIKAYYGAAAPMVQKYFDLCKAQVKDDTVIRFCTREKDPLYSDAFISESLDILQEARNAVADDPVLKDRADRVYAQPLYIKVKKDKTGSKADGSMDELIRILNHDTYRMFEWRPIHEDIRRLQEE